MVTKRRRISRRNHPDPDKAKAGVQVEVEFVDYNPIKEDWSIWELEDGTRIRAKIVLSEVYVPLDPETNEIIRRDDGAPRYGAGIGINVVFEPSESVIVTKKAEEG